MQLTLLNERLNQFRIAINIDMITVEIDGFWTLNWSTWYTIIRKICLLFLDEIRFLIQVKYFHATTDGRTIFETFNFECWTFQFASVAWSQFSLSRTSIWPKQTSSDHLHEIGFVFWFDMEIRLFVPLQLRNNEIKWREKKKHSPESFDEMKIF